jgi:hypothetical protein
MLTREDLIRETRVRGGNLPAFLLLYLALFAAFIGTALAIV